MRVFNQGLLFYLAFAFVPAFTFLLAVDALRAPGARGRRASVCGGRRGGRRRPHPLHRRADRGHDGRVCRGISLVADLKIFQVGMTVGTGFIALR